MMFQSLILNYFSDLLLKKCNFLMIVFISSELVKEDLELYSVHSYLSSRLQY